MRGSTFCALCVLLVTAGSAAAQTPLAKFGVGRAIGVDSAAWSFSYSFNRTPGEEPSSGGYLKAWKLSPNWVAGLKPSSEANIGNGVEVSANNVIAEIGLDFTHFSPQEGATIQRMFLLTPSLNYAADKDFTTSLLYAGVAAQWLIYRSVGPGGWRGHILPGVEFDPGRRRTKSGSHGFTRLVPSLDAQFRKGDFTVGLATKVFVLRNDTSVVSNGAYGLGKLSIAYRLNERTGLSADYVNGFDEPSYKRQNAIRFGIGFYQ